ncbi:MAG: carbohydrate porin [Ignavibacteriaceae bacterium]
MKKYTYIFVILNLIFLSNLNAQSETPGNNSTLSHFRELPGIGMELNYKGEVFSNVSGGMELKSVYLDNIDLIFDFNLDEILGWNGAKINAHILGNHGSDPTEYTGAAQGISNIAAFETWKLYQFWIEQNFLNDNLSLLAGLFDLNSEFDTRETSGIFINPSHGIGAEYALTGQNGPSIFPATSLALRVRYNFSSSWDIKAAVFDGVPGDPERPNGTYVRFNDGDGLLLSSELTYKSASEELNPGYFKYSIGGWYYTSEFEKLTPDVQGNKLYQRGNYGAYISAEKYLVEESMSSGQGLAGFIRLGFADNNVNQVNGYFGAGLHYTGIIPGRDEDVIGLAIASVHNSNAYINLMAQEDSPVERFEHILELTYQFNLTGWLKIQPDIQYVINPVNCDCNDHSFIFGTRLELAL